jgi:sterol desaturase/sphingolipid hydroxylase (fatty acid hydroxylase superfamily)
MVALSLMQGVLFMVFPMRTMEPAGPVRLVLEVLVAALAFDVLFYTAHRTLHTRAFFRFHELHHRFRLIGAWARNTDNAVQVFVIGLFTLPVNFLPMHMEAKASLLFLSTVWNLLQHLGYEVFPRAMWVRRVFITPTHHSMHHTEIDCHFGYFFAFWDDLFGTTHPAYEERFLRVRTVAVA